MQLLPAHIAAAQAKSSDEGKTLLFSKLGLTVVPGSALAELERVERLAFLHNSLRDLPSEFARLVHLRYLNLRGNEFSVLPDSVSLLPALDTLDLSHNKISKFPLEPHKLINLKTLILKRNLITSLPSYISKFHSLRNLNVDRNPLEWPPRAVIDVPSKNDSDEGMADWVRSLQLWMGADISQNGMYSTRPSEDSGYGSADAGKELESHLEDSFNSWSRFGSSPASRRSSHYRGSSTSSGTSLHIVRNNINSSASDFTFDGSPMSLGRVGIHAPHSRTFSVDSSLSIDSIAESEFEDADTDFDISITTNDSEYLDYVSSGQSRAKRRAGVHQPGPSYASSISQEPVEIQKDDASPSLHLGILQTYGPDNSPTRSLFDREGRESSYLPSPTHSEDSRLFERDDSSVIVRENHNSGVTDSSSTSTLTAGSKESHSRNLSLATASQTRRELTNGYGAYGVNPLAKKSLPDLRTAKLNLTKKNPVAERDGSLPPPLPLRDAANSTMCARRREKREAVQEGDDESGITSPFNLRQDSGSSQGTSTGSSSRSISGGIRPLFAGTGKAFDPTSISPTRAPSHTAHLPRQDSQVSVIPNSTTGLHHTPSLASERNSYFKRLSTLPSHSKPLPRPLLTLVDSARSILFALSQIYQALEAFVLNDTNSPLPQDPFSPPDDSDRVASVLRKVLQPASLDLKALITSLSQFDDVWSKRTVPSPATSRTVVETCKEAITAFGKVLSVLSLQMPILFRSVDDKMGPHASEDARFERALVLMLYGAMAEVAGAWKQLDPVKDDLRLLLRDPKDAKSSSPSQQFDNFSLASNRATPGRNTPSQQPRPTLSHFSRRNAGSFSIRDLEIGKTMPEIEEPPLSALSPPLNGTSRSTLRVQKRRPSAAGAASGVNHSPASAASPSDRGRPFELEAPRIDMENLRAISHSREGSQASLHATLFSSSPPLSGNVYPQPIDSTPSTGKSFSTVDRSALYSIREVLDVAAAVWDGLENVLHASESQEGRQIRESLATGRAITRRLAEIVSPSASETGLQGLGDDAKLLLKTIVYLSTVYKSKYASFTPDEALRSKLAQLNTSATELAIFLRVASFTSTTTRAYMPPSPHLSSAGSPGITTTIDPPTPSTAASSLTPSPGPRSAEERRSPELFTSTKVGLSRSRSAQAHASAKPIGLPFEEPRSALPSQTFQIPVSPIVQVQRLNRQRELAVELGDPG